MKDIKIFEVNYETISRFDCSKCNASVYVKAENQAEAIRTVVALMHLNPSVINGAWEIPTIN